MISIDKNEVLKENLPFFKDLSNNEVLKLNNKSSIIKYKKGEFIHTSKSACTGVLIAISGQFRTYISSPTGREITLFNLFDRDVCVLSASCVFKNITYDVNLEAVTDSVAIIIDSSFFKELSEYNTPVSNFLLNLTQDKLSQVLTVIEKTLFYSLEDKISDYLVELSNLNDSNIIYTTHETIANNLGSAREAVTRTLKKFEKDELIKLSRGKITILDSNKLSNISL